MKNCIRKISIFVVSVLFSGNVFLSAKEIVLGGKEGWPVFQKQENLSKGSGRYGYECVQLSTNAFTVTNTTDLLINFENPEQLITEGNYSVVENNLKRTNNAKLEKFSGLSRNMGGLSLSGQSGTFFGSEGLLGSVSIEFWICPSVVENGETLIKWESSKKENGKLIYQLLDAAFNKGHLEWSLSNIFDNIDGKIDTSEIVLKGSTKIIPDTWSYHVLSYDCESGILEYLVNGRTEDIKYITTNGKENGESSLIILGTPSELKFCPDYTGKIDDIRILRTPYSTEKYQTAENAGKIDHFQYAPKGGSFVTKPIMVSTGSVLNSLKAETSVPSQTEILFYVRSGDNYYNWTDSYPEWKPVENGQKISDVKGLYYQVAAQLLPDGNGDKTPSITEIVLDYTELDLPLPPFVVKAVASNASVTISWNYSVDDTVGGYYVYYGNRPGEYLGRVAIEGESPVNAGNNSSFTLTGLENGTIYYFAVAAWSKYDDRVIGNLSKEVFARPLARLK